MPWLDSRINYVSSGDSKASTLVRYLLKELEQHYLIAKDDMMLAARTKPIHGETCCIIAISQNYILQLSNSLYINMLNSKAFDIATLFE